MAFLNHIVLGILILQIYAHAAPSDVSKLEDIANVEQADDTLESTLTPEDVEENGDTTENPRHKRQFYNPYGYGFPPISKLIYPSSFNTRDNYDNLGTFGVEDPLAHIHRRVQEIANIVRQPPPPIPHIPIFYPVLFIPPFDCGCNPTEPTPSGPTTTESNTPAPNVTNRFPETEGERNGGDSSQDGQDFSRPISFDPIVVNRPNARPPPPVEHGTVQSDSGNNQNTPNGDSSSGRLPPPPSTRPPPPQRPATQNPFYNPPPPPPVAFSPVGPPTLCDGAILTCCHQPQVLYNCFAIQGCPNFTPYGNPCETNSVLRVIEKFQRHYDNRNG